MIPIQHQAETSLSRHRIARLMAMEAGRLKSQNPNHNRPSE